MSGGLRTPHIIIKTKKQKFNAKWHVIFRFQFLSSKFTRELTYLRKSQTLVVVPLVAHVAADHVWSVCLHRLVLVSLQTRTLINFISTDAPLGIRLSAFSLVTLPDRQTSLSGSLMSAIWRRSLRLDLLDVKQPDGLFAGLDHQGLCAHYLALLLAGLALRCLQVRRLCV